MERELKYDLGSEGAYRKLIASLGSPTERLRQTNVYFEGNNPDGVLRLRSETNEQTGAVQRYLTYKHRTAKEDEGQSAYFEIEKYEVEIQQPDWETAWPRPELSQSDWQAQLPSLREATAMKAIWNNIVVAESDATIEVEGNQYFPPDSIKRQFFEPSNHHTTCAWKGVANYQTVVADAKVNRDAAWYYPDPKPEAEKIRGYYAFWKGIEVKP